MRKRALAIVGVAVLLAGCDDGNPEYSPDPDEVAVSDIRWPEDDYESEPAIEFPEPLRLTEPTAAMIRQGDGDTIASGQLVTFDCTVFSGEDGSVLNSTYQTGKLENMILSQESVEPTLLAAFLKVIVGGNFVYGTPDTTLTLDESVPLTSPEPDESTGVASAAAQPTALLAINVREVRTLPTEASGIPVDPAPGLPAVTVPTDGSVPTVSVPDADPPGELLVAPLIEGTGEAVTEDQTVVVNYAGWLWSNGTEFDSNWGTGTPISFAMTEVIQGWNEGLIGAKVGSRMLLVIPPDLAYGGSGSGEVPPGATLIILVDVLAAF